MGHQHTRAIYAVLVGLLMVTPQLQAAAPTTASPDSAAVATALIHEIEAMKAPELDPSRLNYRDAYKLLIGAVLPRPIAFVSTLSVEAVPNLSPFAFYNAVSSQPPIVIVSVGHRPDGRRKDSAENAIATGIEALSDLRAPADLIARCLELVEDQRLVPVVTICFIRYAVESSTDRLTLDSSIRTSTGKLFWTNVLEVKTIAKPYTPPPEVTRWGLHPIKLSKFLWATSPEAR